MIDLHRKLHIQLQIGGKRVSWSAKLLDQSANGTVYEEALVAVDNLYFDTVPTDAIGDARRIGSAVEIACSSVSEHMPSRITIDVTNYNHDEWEEEETLQ